MWERSPQAFTRESCVKIEDEIKSIELQSKSEDVIRVYSIFPTSINYTVLISIPNQSPRNLCTVLLYQPTAPRNLCTVQPFFSKSVHYCALYGPTEICLDFCALYPTVPATCTSKSVHSTLLYGLYQLVVRSVPIL
eukprot:Gb_19563 [translate_table: standard]